MIVYCKIKANHVNLDFYRWQQEKKKREVHEFLVRTSTKRRNRKARNKIEKSEGDDDKKIHDLVVTMKEEMNSKPITHSSHCNHPRIDILQSRRQSKLVYR